MQTFTNADVTVNVNDTRDNIILASNETDRIVMEERLAGLIGLPSKIRGSGSV